jgi:hypothetical protein
METSINAGVLEFAIQRPPKLRIHTFTLTPSLLVSEKYSSAHCCRSPARLYGDSRNINSFSALYTYRKLLMYLFTCSHEKCEMFRRLQLTFPETPYITL